MLGERQEEANMERGFCVFTDISGQQIAVNARLVCYVMANQPETTSLIFIDKDHAVSVQGTLNQVITKLRDAYN
jgi:hypothetical protein